eukprot:GHVU01229474.1.p3 GENE.GHVU01229474.1~~GHVU01229474.1.p3  ORF type:complete len:101 (-),score=2.45 GHVU01229474.1:544-846(-)
MRVMACAHGPAPHTHTRDTPGHACTHAGERTDVEAKQGRSSWGNQNQYRRLWLSTPGDTIPGALTRQHMSYYGHPAYPQHASKFADESRSQRCAAATHRT